MEDLEVNYAHQSKLIIIGLIKPALMFANTAKSTLYTLKEDAQKRGLMVRLLCEGGGGKPDYHKAENHFLR